MQTPAFPPLALGRLRNSGDCTQIWHAQRAEGLEGCAARPEQREALFTELHERHRERIQALCQRLTRNEADAQDALQETFLAAHRQIATFRGEARFSTWLHRVALNKCGEIRRRRVCRQHHEGEAVSAQASDRRWTNRGSPTGRFPPPATRQQPGAMF